MPENNKFNWGERSLFYARQFCFPRLVGTPGEKKAATIIKKNLSDLGYQVQKEEFSIFKTPWGYTRILMGISLFLLGTARLFLSSSPILGCLMILLLIMLGVGGGRGWLWFISKEGKHASASSENIWADLRPSVTENDPRLFFCAHYDSKSQTLRLKSRVYWLGTGLGSLVLLLIVFFSYTFSPALWLRSMANLLTLVGAFVAIRLMIVKTGNESPGALDNASGVGMVLACAEYFAQNPPTDFSVRYLFFGAEEYGLQGSVYHVKNHAEEWQSPWVINFDGVGLKGTLRWVKSLVDSKPNPLAIQLIEAAQQANITLKRMPLYPGLMMDHIPFLYIPTTAISLCCTASQSESIHSPQDRENLLEEDGFTEIGTIIDNLIQQGLFKKG
jgi:hypothetical protein